MIINNLQYPMMEPQTGLDHLPDKPQLFCYHHEDGFTQHLLRIDLIIHHDHTCEGTLSFHPAPGVARKSVLLEGPAPQALLDALHTLLNTSNRMRDLQRFYGTRFDDADEQVYILPPQTVKVRGLSPKAENGLQTPAEKQFVAFRRMLQSWLVKTWMR